jgi:hypothetical protein
VPGDYRQAFGFAPPAPQIVLDHATTLAIRQRFSGCDNQFPEFDVVANGPLFVPRPGLIDTLRPLAP